MLQEVLDRLVAVLRDPGADTQQRQDMEQEFIEQFLPFAKRYCSPLRQRMGYDYEAGHEMGALYEVLRTIKNKCQAEDEPISLAYVKFSLPKRYLDIGKEDQSIFTDQTVSLNEPLPGVEEGERIDTIEDRDAHDPFDIMTAQAAVQERRQTAPPPNRKLLDLLKDIWADPDKALHFRDEYLLAAPSRQACFERWESEFEADPTASELALNKRVLAWYCHEFQTDRPSYDTTKKRLRNDLNRFLAQ